MASRRKVTFVGKDGKPTFMKENSESFLAKKSSGISLKPKRAVFPKARVPFYWLFVAFVFFSLSVAGIYEQSRALAFMGEFMTAVGNHIDVTSVPSLFVYVGFNSQVVVSNLWVAFTFLCIGLGFMSLILQWRDFTRYSHAREFEKYFGSDK